jgi:RND superfamily putative drug exporter
MIFDRLARTIIKFHKVIIILWLATLVAAVPLANRMESVIVYTESHAIPSYYPSEQAKYVAAQEFPSWPNTSAVLVIKADDVRSDQIRHYVLRLNQTIWTNPNVNHLQNVTSIYNIYLVLLRSYVNKTNEVLYDIRRNVVLVLGPNASEDEIEEETIKLAAPLLNATDETRKEILRAIYRLGPHAFNNHGRSGYTRAVLMLADRLLWRYSIEDYPVQPWSQLYHQFVSQDNQTMIISFGFSQSARTPSVENSVNAIRHDAWRIADEMGLNFGQDLEFYLTGEPAFSADTRKIALAAMEKVDIVAIGLIIFIIGAFFISLVAAATPPLIIGVVFIVAQALVYFVGKYVAPVFFLGPDVMRMAMLGAGCDYGIFMMARYCDERRAGRSKEEAVVETVRWVGEAITGSAGTSMVGFGSLAVVPFSLFQTMGLCVMIGIGCALLAALTLIPSLLALFGDWLYWPRRLQKSSSNDKGQRGYFVRSTQFTLRHAKLILITAILATLPAVYVVANSPSSYDSILIMPKCEAKDGYYALTTGFPKGRILQTQLYIQFDAKICWWRSTKDGTGTNFNHTILEAVDTLTYRLLAVDGVANVSSPTMPYGKHITWWRLGDNARNPMKPIESRKTYEQMALSYISQNNQTALLQITLGYEPYSVEAMNTVGQIRNLVNQLQQEVAALRNAKMYIGGATQANMDLMDCVNTNLAYVVTVLMVGIFLILLFMLGSVLLPARLIFTIILSFIWTIALTTIVFQAWLNIPIYWFIPIMLFTVVNGLGIDYDIFLVSRIREEVVKGRNDEKAIEIGVQRTGGIITACGLVMAGAFSSFVFSGFPILMEIGFAIAIAILLDTWLVRVYLVPAIMLLMKRWNWWAPKPLMRVKGHAQRRV